MKRSVKIILVSLIVALIASVGFNVHSAYINYRQRISTMQIVLSYASGALSYADHLMHGTSVVHENAGFGFAIMLLEIDTVMRSDFKIMRNIDGRDTFPFPGHLALIGDRIILEPVLENRIEMMQKTLPHLQSLVLELSIYDYIEFPIIHTPLVNTRLPYADFITIISRFVENIRAELAD